ncbi:MAG: DUF983 domain-containing protein [Cytophagaceae bacterium]|jgi:hypothetical protein|nr:DUF983 domain-containing protein [Cytophagaceae bacterium]
MFGFIWSVVRLKCPKCRKGNMFVKSSLFAIRDGHKMVEHCSCCGLKMEPEPGFYYGGMYVSYMLNVAFFMPLFLAYAIWLQPYVNAFLYFVLLVLVLLALSPYIFRLSRALYLAFFVSYDPEKNR